MYDFPFNEYMLFGGMTIYDHLPVQEPPTLYKLIDSKVNGGKGLFDADRVPTLKIAEAGREFIFAFEYPLSQYADKKLLEETFIKRFLMRRIGFETYSAFEIALDARFNEIMPAYNLLFDALGEKYDLLTGSGYTREYHEDTSKDRDQSTTSDGTTETTTDNRFSDTPQNRLQDIQNGDYMTEYQYNQGESTTSASGTMDENESGQRDYVEKYKSDIDGKTALLQQYNANAFKIYTRIYNDCEDLFFQLF